MYEVGNEMYSMLKEWQVIVELNAELSCLGFSVHTAHGVLIESSSKSHQHIAFHYVIKYNISHSCQCQRLGLGKWATTDIVVSGAASAGAKGV